MNDPLLVAHRGLPRVEIENSAASFRAALDAQVRAIELDVRMSADGLLVCLHDEEPKALCGEARPAARMSARELLALRFLDRPDQGLCLLDEVLAMTGSSILLDVEVKPDPLVPAPLLADALARTIDRAGGGIDLLVTSEDEGVLAAMRERLPDLPRGLVFRSADERDPFELARELELAAIVASEKKVDAAFVDRSHQLGISLWCYTVNEPDRAKELAGLGVDGLVTDDVPGMDGVVQPMPLSSFRPDHGGSILAIDVGSSLVKAALVSPNGEILLIERQALPVQTGDDGAVEHDPEEALAIVRGLIGRIAARANARPRAAAIASQRSTSLVCRRGDLRPLSPAVSWRDRRGRGILAELEGRRAELEEAAGLPMLEAWSAVKGRVICEGRLVGENDILAPLGSWIAARLTGSEPLIDPTLANRTFLLDRSGLGWNLDLLDAFGYMADQLPHLVPTRHDFGRIPWPDGESVPLEVMIGDQQAAYLGAVGPMSSALVLNLGTGAFAMRAVRHDEKVPASRRRAPLFWRGRSPAPRRFLVEEPVLPDGEEAKDIVLSDMRDASRRFARELALGELWPERRLERLAAAVSALASPSDRRLVVAGGASRCPQLVASLRRKVPMVVERPRQSELTLIGAARMTVFSW